MITPQTNIITNKNFQSGIRLFPQKAIFLTPALCHHTHNTTKRQNNFMNIHKYQTKALLHNYSTPVSNGHVIYKNNKAKTTANKINNPLWIVKAQIHTSSRNKGHFKKTSANKKDNMHIAKSVEEATNHTTAMLSHTLITHQTSPADKTIDRIYIENNSDIAHELYLALLVDRQSSHINFIISTKNDMNIKKITASTPKKIITFNINPATI